MWVLVAMLVELSFYFSLGFPGFRRRLEELGEKLGPAMVLSAVVPYAVYAAPLGLFRWQSLAVLLLLAAGASYWYRLLPRHAVTDLAFLCLMAGVVLGKLFHWVYAPPEPRLAVEVLGQLMWIRLGVVAVLVVRRMEGIGFGLIPNRREWRIGVKHYGLFLPAGLALSYGLGFARFDPAPGWWWRVVPTFLGMLWVVALSEEFFFRGMLQQLLSEWLGVQWGLLLTAVLFGAVHLPFRGFPNWEFACLAGVAGWVYGRAFLQGRGIRAAMVTHALAATTWQTLFR